MAKEVGLRLAETGVTDRADDVYWLEWEELNEMASVLDAGGTPLNDVTETVKERRARWESRKRLNPPVILPDQIQFLGFSFDTQRFEQGREETSENVIRGGGTSPGQVTGRACVIHGPEDFAKFRADDVLVARMTAPAWTPLFAKASAVVTDIGGPVNYPALLVAFGDSLRAGA
ncbi:PEP-utilizing enzyme [Natrinema gelatinilyticum]|uniref:PEP-utilizing enzyme n=1 Tax=Natrinema gelatinilyticum TaxID=2961571 RepID=UPI0020C55080|nr:PEP-utilizing enzyme [Natrinema gelatinilyticum]